MKIEAYPQEFFTILRIDLDRWPESCRVYFSASQYARVGRVAIQKAILGGHPIAWWEVRRYEEGGEAAA